MSFNNDGGAKVEGLESTGLEDVAAPEEGLECSQSEDGTRGGTRKCLFGNNVGCLHAGFFWEGGEAQKEGKEELPEAEVALEAGVAPEEEGAPEAGSFQEESDGQVEKEAQKKLDEQKKEEKNAECARRSAPRAHS